MKEIPVIFKQISRILFWLGLGLVLAAIGFMGAFPGLTVTVLPLLIFFFLPIPALALLLNAGGKDLDRPYHHGPVNPWQPTQPPSNVLTPEFELAELNSKLTSLKSEEAELENEIELLAGQVAPTARI
jgi:hypothetical protein